MNRNKLKTYAPQARREFIQAITDRASFYGLAGQLIDLFEHGKTFGSLIQVPEVLAEKLPAIAQRVEDVLAHGGMLEQAVAKSLKPLVEQAWLLAQKYDAIVANPPCMGSWKITNEPFYFRPAVTWTDVSRVTYSVRIRERNARVDHLAEDIAAASATSHRKKLEKERDTMLKQRAELLAFDEKLRHCADQRITLDLDDGVKVNYGKFGDLLAEVKAITGSKAEE